MNIKTRISRDCAMFFGVEYRNTEGMNNDIVKPATLGSAYDSFLQAPDEVLCQWCGYNKKYPYSPRLFEELGLELRRLIRKHGKKTELRSFQYVRDNE